MSSKLATVFTAYCLFYILIQIEGSFIKPNNVPRVGRSNEAASPFDDGMMGYVFKTNKNVPRIGRRNYDSENRYDIPKFYQLPRDNVEFFEDDVQGSNPEQIEPFYGKQLENMKR